MTEIECACQRGNQPCDREHARAASCYHDDEGWWVRGRHLEHPADWEGDCKGCQPCTANHCEDCGRVHVGEAEQVCPACIGRTRDNLGTLVDLYAAMPDEAEHCGVNSEAASLTGPVTDPEAWSWRRATRARAEGVLISTLDEEDDTHPVALLRRWVWMLGEDYGDEPDHELALTELVDFLDRRLGRIAHDVGQDWRLFSREVRRCKRHMEKVLHDSKEPDRSRVPCLDCDTLLAVVYEGSAKDDHHVCPRCRRPYDHDDFSRAKAQWLSSEGAERYVLLSDAVKAVERSEFTIRTWVRRGTVSAACDRRTHRLLVWWPDVRDANKARHVQEVGRQAG